MHNLNLIERQMRIDSDFGHRNEINSHSREDTHKEIRHCISTSEEIKHHYSPSPPNIDLYSFGESMSSLDMSPVR